jgi:biofilm PGA synthesis N-glycosyltransferase PgaC
MKSGEHPFVHECPIALAQLLMLRSWCEDNAIPKSEAISRWSMGGEDWYAEIRARSRGWHVRALPELKVMHHRVTGGAGSLLRHRFREGKMDFSVGSHPAFELIKCARRFPEHPACVGTIARLAGFFSSYFNSALPLVPPEIVDFLRKEQMNKVRTFIYRQ